MSRQINPGLSLYLDLVRFLAAISVVLYHTWDTLFPQSGLKWPAHEAVVIFFVLSGYVISHAAARPGMTLAVYLQHRAARILPVAIAALVLAALITPWVATPSFNETTPGSIASSAFWWGTIANGLFIAQAGGFFITAPFNTPFWSLNYEVWYYLIFAAWMFAPKPRRNILTLAAVLLAGPKILLLLPVWWYGVWLYKQMPRLGPASAYIVFIASLAIAAAMTWLNVSDAIRAQLYAFFPPAWHAHFSTQFIYDWILGLVIAANFAAVASLENRIAWLFTLQKPIRYLSTFTFSLYVFHMPLAVLAWDGLGLRQAWWFYGFVLIGVFLMAQLTERRIQFYRGLMAARLKRY